MYQTISKERCLFFIDSSYEETFKNLAATLHNDVIQPHNNVFNEEHTWISIFNVWLLLQPEDKLIIEAFDKAMYYSFNQLIIKTLKKDYHFKFFRNNPKHTAELLFIGAIYLTNGIGLWIRQSMQAHQLDDILIRFQEKDYFDSHTASPEEIEQFMNDQARMVKLLAMHLHKDNSFSRMIKKQCDEAFFYYRDHHMPVTPNKVF